MTPTKDFLFVHIPRTGGSAVTRALRPYSVPFSFSNHSFAAKTKKQLGDRVWKRLFTFGTVRNPWDRQVSLYTYIQRDPSHHLHETIKDKTFKEYVQWVYDNGSCAADLQKDFLYDGEEQLVTYVMRYEHLIFDFKQVCGILGVEAVLEKRPRPVVDYRKLYDEESRSIVQAMFDVDCRTFGYSF